VKLIEEMAPKGQFDQSIHTHIRELNETLKNIIAQLNNDYPNIIVPE
jgi:hypothetical protein